MTIYECYQSTKKQLAAAGIENEVQEARELIRFITRYDNTQILTRYNEPLSVIQTALWNSLIKQRLSHTPLQYLIGEWDFYGFSFAVGEGVLVPRADTETLVDVGIEYLKKHPTARVADLCAGSGCIGISLAKRFGRSRVELVEKYDTPVSYLETNLSRLKAENAFLTQADLYEWNPREKAELIVSNPPYIPADEMETINEEARHEPPEALYGGEDGLNFYRLILSRIRDWMVPGGMLAVEVGRGQDEAVRQLFAGTGLIEIGSREDLGGVQRVIFGTLPVV